MPSLCPEDQDTGNDGDRGSRTEKCTRWKVTPSKTLVTTVVRLTQAEKMIRTIGLAVGRSLSARVRRIDTEIFLVQTTIANWITGLVDDLPNVLSTWTIEMLWQEKLIERLQSKKVVLVRRLELWIRAQVNDADIQIGITSEVGNTVQVEIHQIHGNDRRRIRQKATSIAK